MSASEAERVAAAVDGDEDALSALLEEHGVAVRRGLKISPRWQGVLDLDDVMQVTYLEAFLHIRKFKGESARSFPNWLRRIAERNLLDAIRELEREPGHMDVRPAAGTDSYVALLDEVAGTTTSPSQSAGKREVHQIVEEALQKLPTEYERVLRLHALEGKPGVEVAAILGRSHGAVRMLICRAKDRLREILGTGAAFFSDTA